EGLEAAMAIGLHVRLYVSGIHQNLSFDASRTTAVPRGTALCPPLPPPSAAVPSPSSAGGLIRTLPPAGARKAKGRPGLGGPSVRRRGSSGGVDAVVRVDRGRGVHRDG